MSAEVRPEKSPTPDPGSTRKQKVAVRWAIAIIGVIAIVVAHLGNLSRSSREMWTARRDVQAWASKIVTDDRSLRLIDSSSELGENLLGTWAHYEGVIVTPAGLPIRIDFSSSDRLFKHSDRLVLIAGERSVTWPIEDVGRGRKVDLKAEFPEAFR